MSIAGRHRRARRIALWVGAVLVVLSLSVAMFPWGLVARHAAGPLSRTFGRPVVIGSARRADWIGFVPTIELHDVRIGQPAWAGPGDMARIAAMRLRLPVLPLLVGQVRPRSIDVAGLWLHLIGDAKGRENWSSGKPPSGGSRAPRIAGLTIRDGRVRLDDARRHVVLDATLGSDLARGLRIEGAGTLRGSALSLSIAAPAIGAAASSQPYPAAVMIRSPLVTADARLRMDHPLDIGHFSASFRTSGRDLQYLDDILQAGLFPSQAFRIAGDVRHDGLDWHSLRLAGTIGRSDLRAKLDATRHDGRTNLAGTLDARTLDFDDFASDEDRARGAAKQRRDGPRVIPSSRIVLTKLGKLDGRLVVRAAALLSSRQSPFRALAGVVVLDHRVLTIAPLAVSLPRGTMTGQLRVDGQGASPKLSMDLRIAGATIETFFPDQQVFAGPMRGRVQLSGNGDTVHDALARGQGRMAIVVENGTMRRDYATFLGGDIVKSVGAALKGKAERTPLNCLVADFRANAGRFSPAPLIVATPVARGDGEGSIVLGSEAIDLRLIGRPVKAGLLQSTAPVRVFGTLFAPRIDIKPPRAEDEAGSSMLARVGFLIKKLHVRGDAAAAPAAPVACASLIASAMR